MTQQMCEEGVVSATRFGFYITLQYKYMRNEVHEHSCHSFNLIIRDVA